MPDTKAKLKRIREAMRYLSKRHRQFKIDTKAKQLWQS